MKRTLFTTAILLSFLSSCQKETSSIEKEMEPIVFTACIAESADTKVSVDCTDGKVSWVAGDSIFISNGSVTKTYIADKSGATTTFTVKESSEPGFTEAAQYSATYGTMPSPGAAQQYSDTPGALVYMEAPKTESTTTPDFTFDVKCGLLKLNLTAADKSVKRISVSDGTNTYSLVCETAQSIETATDFYIALPAGSYTKYIIRDSEGYEAVKTAKSTGTAIASNQINKVTFNTLNFAAPKYTEGVYTGDGTKIGSTWWAPVNCGYDATNYPMGLLYQWGRKYGQAYETGTIRLTSMSKSDDTEGNKGNFGKYNTTDYNWFSDGVDNTLWNGGTKGAKDPCPEGWRVPTSTELQALITTKEWTTTGGPSCNQAGCLFGTAPNKVFLRTAGYRSYDGSAYNRGDYGHYWSSSVDGDDAWSLYFHSDSAGMYEYSRADGCSVRCVQE